MSEKVIFNVVHGRKSPDGQKTFWNRVGMAILYPEDNRISINLSSVPVGEWDGWLNCYPKDAEEERQESPQGHSRSSTKSESRAGSRKPAHDEDFVDDIAF